MFGSLSSQAHNDGNNNNNNNNNELPSSLSECETCYVLLFIHSNNDELKYITRIMESEKNSFH
jgi:hypothetical protein